MCRENRVCVCVCVEERRNKETRKKKSKIAVACWLCLLLLFGVTTQGQGAESGTLVSPLFPSVILLFPPTSLNPHSSSKPCTSAGLPFSPPEPSFVFFFPRRAHDGPHFSRACPCFYFLRSRGRHDPFPPQKGDVNAPIGVHNTVLVPLVGWHPLYFITSFHTLSLFVGAPAGKGTCK